MGALIDEPRPVNMLALVAGLVRVGRRCPKLARLCELTMVVATGEDLGGPVSPECYRAAVAAWKAEMRVQR